MTAAFILSELQSVGTPEKAVHLSRFFKTGPGQYGEGDQFLGVVVPQTRSIAKANKATPFDELQLLLDSPWHEARLCALLILVYRFQDRKAMPEEREAIFRFYLKNMRRCNNWDLVDLTCRDIVGEYLVDKDRSLLYRLAESENLWEQRISIVSTWAFIRRNDFGDTLELSERLIGHKHDLMHKAVGWMLREVGKKRADLYGFLDREIDSGRQVYIVCPAIEDAGGSGLNAVKSYYEDIAKAYLPDRRVGLMHGKLKPKEKAEVMDDFKSGRLDALVSTTVIEVGVDVPNATVMVIENAERYGLSALHQLRGRVGRGAAESWCFLVSDNASESVQKRLKFLCSTSDGFAVAQYDLETRGPGDFFGSRQHGLPTLQIADLMNDTRTLHAAQSEAVALLAEDPLLERPEHALLARQVEQMFDKAGAMN